MRGSVFSSSILLLALVLAVGCSYTPALEGEPVLAQQQQLQCNGLAGVSLVDGNAVEIRLGQRPTAGYSVQLLRQQISSGRVILVWEEQRPNGMVAQVMTAPCMSVALPSEWQELEVRNRQTGQAWLFRSVR